MLTLKASGQPLKIDDYYVRELASGYDELIFDISIYDPLCYEIQEETIIIEQSALTTRTEYVVKAVDAGAKTQRVKCQINFGAWKGSVWYPVNSGTKTVAEVLDQYKPYGWTIIDQSGITIGRTIQMDGGTPLDVAEACRDTYGVTFRWNNIAKTCTIINTDSYTPSGAYVDRALNLKSNEYKGKSTDFATILYPFGKDGIGITSVNEGRPYISDYSYTTNQVAAYWKDERFTTPETLLEGAKKRLAAMCVPDRSYNISILDLASIEPEDYGFLAMPLYSIVGVVDPARSSTKVNHQVVQRDIYPYHPDKNVITLSTRASRVQSQVSSLSRRVSALEESGNTADGVSVSSGGVPVAKLWQTTDGRGVLTLIDKDNPSKTSVQAYALASGAGGVVCQNADGKTATTVSAGVAGMQTNAGGFIAHNAAGTKKALLGVGTDGGGAVQLTDASGNSYTLTPALIQKLINL